MRKMRHPSPPAVMPGTDRKIVGVPASAEPKTHDGDGTSGRSAGGSSSYLHENMSKARQAGVHEEMTQSRAGKKR
jgi:hypothetical protein